MYKVEATVRKQIRFIEEEEEVGKIKDYIDKMTEFVKNYKNGDKMKNNLDNVLFLSTQQCQKR